MAYDNRWQVLHLEASFSDWVLRSFKRCDWNYDTRYCTVFSSPAGYCKHHAPLCPRLTYRSFHWKNFAETQDVLDKKIGSQDTPFAQRLHYGWVIIGEVYPEWTRTPLSINSKKTFVRRKGRVSLESCSKIISVKQLDTNNHQDKIIGSSRSLLGWQSLL